MCLEVSGEDVENLVNECCWNHHWKAARTSARRITDEEEQTEKNVPSLEIKGIFIESIGLCGKKWLWQSYCKPCRICYLFGDNVLPHFMKYWKMQEKQITFFGEKCNLNLKLVKFKKRGVTPGIVLWHHMRAISEIHLINVSHLINYRRILPNKTN